MIIREAIHSEDQDSTWPQPTGVANGGIRQLANELKYRKSPSLGFVVVAGEVEMPMPWQGKYWRLICCDSAFLVVASTRLIIYSVMLFWTIAPSPEEV